MKVIGLVGRHDGVDGLGVNGNRFGRALDGLSEVDVRSPALRIIFSSLGEQLGRGVDADHLTHAVAIEGKIETGTNADLHDPA